MNASKTKAMIGIYALAMLSMATLVMSPVMSLVVKAFHGYSISSIQMILSIAQLTGIISAFVVGRLAMTISSKNLALTGAAGTFVFGIFPYFFHTNLWFLITCSALVGFSMGFITNTLPALVAESFEVEERQAVIGRQVSFTSLGTMLLLFISGQLGSISWYSSYLTYIIVVICGIVACIFLPNIKKEGNAQGQNPKVSIKDALNYKVLIIAVFGFFFMIVNNVYNNNISLFIAEKSLGNTATVGLVSMVSQLGGLLAGFAVGQLSKIFKTQMMSLSLLLEGFALLLIAFSSNISLVFIGSFLAGCGLSLFFSQAPFLITIAVTPTLISMGMAVLSIFNSFGGFLSPTFANSLSAAFSGGTVTGAMFIGGIISVLAGVICAVTGFQKKMMADIQK